MSDDKEDTPTNILTLASTKTTPPAEEEHDSFAESNDVLISGMDMYTTVALVGIDSEGVVRVSYPAITPSQLLTFAEILRKEALDLMFYEE